MISQTMSVMAMIAPKPTPTPMPTLAPTDRPPVGLVTDSTPLWSGRDRAKSVSVMITTLTLAVEASALLREEICRETAAGTEMD
jgi:hypothetical protein